MNFLVLHFFWMQTVFAETNDEQTLDDNLDLDTKVQVDKSRILEVDEVQQVIFPLIYDGTDQQKAISHMSLATDIPSKQIAPFRYSKLIEQTEPFIVDAKARLFKCPGSQSSMALIKMLYQKGNNALNYYELEKAENYFDKAAEGIICLKDPVDIEIISSIYYLSGVTNYFNGDIKNAENDFQKVLKLDPEFNWDPVFPPDAKEPFDRAQKAVAGQRDVELQIYPVAAKGNILINGIEPDEQNIALVPPGINLVQVFGEHVNTYFLQVNQNSSSMTLFLPQSLPNNQIEHEIDATNSDTQDLGYLLSGYYNSQQQVYVQSQDSLYAHITGTDHWTKEDLTTFEQNTLWLKSDAFAKGLTVSGIGLATVAGSVSLINIGTAIALNRQGTNTDSFAVYDTNRTRYQRIENNHPTWVTATLVGLGMTGVGLSLSF